MRPRLAVTPEMMAASRAQPGDSESAAAAFDRVLAEADRADVFETVLHLYGPPTPPRPTMAEIVPIASARKPRTAKQFAADIHNAHLLIRYDYGDHETSRKYVELIDTEAKQIIARDLMPSIMVAGPDGVLGYEYVEIPGPNCLDTLSERLRLTDEERAQFRTRREDSAVMVAEYAAIRRSELEMPS